MVWATIMPFGPVTLIFYWPQKKYQALYKYMENTFRSPLHSRGDIYFSSCPSVGHKNFVSATSPALLLGMP